MAVSGVFLIVRAASDSPSFTRLLQTIVTTLYLSLYLQYESDPRSPWIFYVLYMGIFECILYRKLYNNLKFKRGNFFVMGVVLVFINVGALETIGHGVYEKHHSYVLEFFNSVVHTPLYGINSILSSSGFTEAQPKYDHVCW